MGRLDPCILHNNAVLVFVDVCPDRSARPEQIETAITPRNWAILAVHIFGQAANMTAIRHRRQARSSSSKTAARPTAPSTQAPGGNFQTPLVRAWVEALATAEAGYMVTPHADVYWKAALCSQHMGRSPEPDFPHGTLGKWVDSLVYTYRLSPMVAVILAEQVKKIDSENGGRRESVALFREKMKDVSLVTFPTYAEGDDPVYHMLTMNFDEERAGIKKPTFFEAIRAEASRASSTSSPIPTWARLHWQTYDGRR